MTETGVYRCIPHDHTKAPTLVTKVQACLG
jgi:hypothetical protein